MNSDMKKELKTYYREIRSLLIVRSRETKKFMRDFIASVEDFTAQDGIDSFAQVRAHFGEPEDIARAFLETAPLKDIRKRVRMRTAVLAVVFAAFAIWACYLTIAFVHEMDNGYGVESGVMDPDETTEPGYVIYSEVQQ